MSRKIVIIGSSIAGISAAEAARRQDAQAQIVLLSADRDLPYYRLRLCEVLDDPSVEADLIIEQPSWYEQRQIDLRLDSEVVAIDRAAKILTLKKGSTIAYDKLIIASGSQSLVPPIQGIDLGHVYKLWTLADARKLASALKKDLRVVVIGGGLLGLLAADHISRTGAKVRILERGDRLIANQLDITGSAVFKKAVDTLGIAVEFSADTTEILSDGVKLADGRFIEADLILVSIGVKANIGFTDNTGLAATRRLVTDARMQTSDPDIYAAGDAAEPDQYWFGLWPVAMDQGWVAGINAAGGDTVYSKYIPPYLVQAMGTQVAVQGDRGASVDGQPDAAIELDHDVHGGIYHKLIYRGDIFTGFMLVGDTRDFVDLQKKLGHKRGLL